MNLATVEIDAPPEADAQLESALVRRCELTDEAVLAIVEAQRAHNITFIEAALRLGFVTRDDIDSARASGRKLALIERKALRPGSQLVLANDPFNPRNEQVRALRTELLLRHQGGHHANIVAVLSPCAGEGRSLLSAELAISFAQLGQTTLLVDADLRNPRQHLLFGSDNREGLSQAIATDSAPCIHPVENFPDLFLLTAGPSPANPMELLSAGRFESLIESWRRRYEHVVIDTPAVSENSDALAVATLAGRVLVVSRAQRTPYKATREMLRRLAATQSQILGAVISHF
ncbi:MAG TPA: CpsD/CapB family tyrosine-protein kinase [Solimonas sp.]|nr:CpsD/CapB family tyrosine-protein kinase [Solimonas sp.]